MPFVSVEKLLKTTTGGQMDHRSWFKHEPLFASAITFITISPSELDVVELGVRPSVAFCQYVADQINDQMSNHVRILHPVEYPRNKPEIPA